MFQFALPRGERPADENDSVAFSLFQFALPRGERPYLVENVDIFETFQFALPRGERRMFASEPKTSFCFNSRSRVGSDKFEEFMERVWYVSIRAPAWGATVHRDRGRTRLGVSIRAPAWGATRERLLASPEEHVSIRAPAWGATYRLQFLRIHKVVSIRAPAWGATAKAAANMYNVKFQFALPRGERHRIFTYENFANSFNSRSRVGSDFSFRWA